MTKISEFFLKYPITIIKDLRLHKKILLQGFLGATIYSIIYGIYEYFVVYHGIKLIDILGSIINWTIMWMGLIITIAIITHFNFQNIIMGLFYMSFLEDLMFWLCQWGSTGIYPFPAADWWDVIFASYRILGNWGRAVSFWPYVPFYYLPSSVMIIIYYVAAYKGAIYGRITAWLIGPFFLVIVGTAFVNDFIATLILIFGPFLFLAYAFTLTLWAYHQSEKNSQNT